MKTKLLFLIGIELIVMFPKPGLQYNSYSENESGVKYLFNKDIGKNNNSDMKICCMEENKKDCRNQTLYISSANSYKKINHK